MEQRETPVGQFPDDGSVDSDFLNMLSAEAIQYIHEDATKQIVEVLTNTGDTAEAVAATTYKITKGLMDRHKPEAISLEADLNHAMALGAEVTDMLIEVAQAAQPDAQLDVEKLREEALLRATVMHGEDVEARNDPEAKQEAAVMYAGMMEDGTVDEALSYADTRSVELGLNTNDTMRKGIEEGTKFGAQTLKKAPVAEGVSEGTRQLERIGKVDLSGSNAPVAYNPEPPMATATPETDEETTGLMGEPSGLQGANHVGSAPPDSMGMALPRNLPVLPREEE